MGSPAIVAQVLVKKFEMRAKKVAGCACAPVPGPPRVLLCPPVGVGVGVGEAPVDCAGVPGVLTGVPPAPDGVGVPPVGPDGACCTGGVGAVGILFDSPEVISPPGNLLTPGEGVTTGEGLSARGIIGFDDGGPLTGPLVIDGPAETPVRSPMLLG